MFKEVGSELEVEEESKFLPRAVETGIRGEEEVGEEPYLFVYTRIR